MKQVQPARWNGKAWAELTPVERCALFLHDRALYERVRDARWCVIPGGTENT